eukprot:TRINITY_DN68255_c0_g1_i1.p1 TRINITY_DN68255_c0_g1~~TRINITY_DN68255_c0_g1_i1.p1  ORF type:complete len:743 (+),score=109.48 TRINITY_DN68255_c0_g1_i1:125-2353(+)
MASRNLLRGLPFETLGSALAQAPKVLHTAHGVLQKGASVDNLRRVGDEILSKPPNQQNGASSRVGAPEDRIGAVGRWMSAASQTAVDNSARSGIDSVNAVIAALGMQVKIITTGSVDRRVDVHVTETPEPKTATPLGDPNEIVSLDKLTPRCFVVGLRAATNSGQMVGLENYIDTLLAERRLVPVKFLSSRIQRNVYLDVARIIVFTFQRVLMQLDSAVVWGHRLEVKTAPSFRGLVQGRQGRRRRTSAVGLEQLETVFDEMCTNAIHPLVPQVVQKRLYVNCFMVVVQLFEDLLAGDGQSIHLMGHQIVFQLEAQPIDVLKSLSEEIPRDLGDVDERIVMEFTDELLADATTNIKWLPDVIESAVYKGVMRMMLVIVQHTIERLSINVLGREVHMSFRPNDKPSTSPQSETGAALYTEDDSPLSTVSSTELEERLKDLTEQRRILRAIKDLGGASFDLMLDTPMVGADTPKTQETSSSAWSNGTESAKTAARSDDVASERVHEFQTMAHTMKLARSLSTTVDVASDIEVPFGMISDLGTYALWMPWCTDGRTEPDDSSDSTKKKPMLAAVHGFESASAKRQQTLDGCVTFGFETGTFLGTVGDTVQYRIGLNPPGCWSEQPGPTPSEATKNEDSADGVAGGAGKSVTREGVVSARVVADAVNGFTYGDRLIYDWRFHQIGDGRTKVELDMLFQASNVLYMPLWDSMQNMVMNKMLAAFQNRAELLYKQKVADAPPSAPASK